MSAKMHEAAQVYCRVDGKTYLEVVPTRLGVRIQLTPQARHVLESYWTVWLRKLLLSPGQPRTIGVKLDKNCLNVSWSGSRESLVETVCSIAAQIRPLPKLPMRRVDAPGGQVRVRWAFSDVVTRQTMREFDYSAFGEALENVRLPRGCELGIAPAWAASLFTNQSSRIPAWEAALLVEMQIALSLHHSHSV